MSELASVLYKEWTERIDKGLTLAQKVELEKCLEDNGLTMSELLEKER